MQENIATNNLKVSREPKSQTDDSRVSSYMLLLEPDRDLESSERCKEAELIPESSLQRVYHNAVRLLLLGFGIERICSFDTISS